MRLEGWKRLAMTNGIGIRRLEKDRVNDGCLLCRKNNGPVWLMVYAAAAGADANLL
jgi:hypothetical protein